MVDHGPGPEALLQPPEGGDVAQGQESIAVGGLGIVRRLGAADGQLGQDGAAGGGGDVDLEHGVAQVGDRSIDQLAEHPGRGVVEQETDRLADQVGGVVADHAFDGRAGLDDRQVRVDDEEHVVGQLEHGLVAGGRDGRPIAGGEGDQIDRRLLVVEVESGLVVEVEWGARCLGFDRRAVVGLGLGCRVGIDAGIDVDGRARIRRAVVPLGQDLLDEAIDAVWRGTGPDPLAPASVGRVAVGPVRPVGRVAGRAIAVPATVGPVTVGPVGRVAVGVVGRVPRWSSHRWSMASGGGPGPGAACGGCGGRRRTHHRCRGSPPPSPTRSSPVR